MPDKPSPAEAIYPGGVNKDLGNAQVDNPFTPLSLEDHKAMLFDTLVAKRADPALNEGSVADRRQAVENMLDNHGRVRGHKDIPAFKEHLRNLPEDVRAYDMKDSTIIFHRLAKPAPLVG